MKTLGICLGASTISMVQLEGNHPFSPIRPKEGIRVVHSATYPHGGNPKQTLLTALSSLDLPSFDRIAATGRRFRHFVNFASISEPEAVELAYAFLRPPAVMCPAVVSAGGETFMVYVLNQTGQISTVVTGNKCASGTGEFFNQQLRRMNATLEQAMEWSSLADPYQVSGRCSVFCKSDCTHAVNKGIPKSRVTAGLCRMMAGKILELLKKVEKKDIMITGGAAANQTMIAFLKQEIPGLVVPREAPYFEALGAALWALSHEAARNNFSTNLFSGHAHSFDTLPPLNRFEDQVVFNSMTTKPPAARDRCILGLDVGSTTTKAVLMRVSDNAVCASVYLQTDGDPVAASRDCYRRICEQVQTIVDPSQLAIVGLGVCGSGRQIAALHALTDGIINEIIAHAAAAVYFDPDVDTLFEIGGQDAKYTYITSGVPSDYAMNEACSAGTGSFLAEAAYETLGIPVEDIAEIALQAENPPNFNDQCAAFISSDIKTAIHEGIDHSDIVAGLVYSICMNYNNRVKGNRPVGRKIFMQGGVCYNRAVPLAMAALTGRKIIVPPEPGLMGAFGAALEIKKRMDLGLIRETRFDLEALSERTVRYGKSFVCGGGRERCDRGCEISMIELEGRKFPFGGACNRYYNLRHQLAYDVENLDLVRAREKLIFPHPDTEACSPTPDQTPSSPRKTVGINKSFLVNTFYPFYEAFFTSMGVDPVLAKTVSKPGIDRKNAAFCYPAELAHGFFHGLIERVPPLDYIFLPHVHTIPVDNKVAEPQTCPFVQGEPFYLQTTFAPEMERIKNQGTRILSPFVYMPDSMADARSAMIQAAEHMGKDRKTALKAFDRAVQVQNHCVDRMKALGQGVLEDLTANPEKIAVVVFGRSYNTMVEEAHMGIPHKFASRGVTVLPFDFLPFAPEDAKPNMYWAMGQMILKAARFVQKHPQLFGVYITNFSCGPDSFLITYFRGIMGRKPSLTLELDSHTADAGLETRIEAFLDIVRQYRQLILKEKPSASKPAFPLARTFFKKQSPYVRTSAGLNLPLTDPRVTLLVPSMGRISTQAISAVFADAGYHVAPLRSADDAILKLGRAHTSCKECLPLILTTGTLLDYVYHQKKSDEVLVYFMPSASGPCRFGQYAVFMEDLIRRLGLPDVAVFSLTSDNTYSTMGRGFDNRKAWAAIVLGDLMEDVRAMLLANAVDPVSAREMFDPAFASLLNALVRGGFSDLQRELAYQIRRLSAIPAKQPYHEVPKILLTGEIFVRRDEFSRQQLTEHLAEMGFAVVCSPVSEWLRYSDYLQKNNGLWPTLSLLEKAGYFLRQTFMDRYEKHLVAAFARSGILNPKPVNLPHLMHSAAPFISEKLSGEAILTVGASLAEVATDVCGVIALGPFGCMPNRMAEAILNDTMTRDVKLRAARNWHPEGSRKLEKILENMDDLPFLAIETDGSPYPQLIHAKLEAFCQRALRLHQRMVQEI